MFGVDAVRAAGGIAEGTICYTGDLTDPRRTKVCVRFGVVLGGLVGLAHCLCVLCVLCFRCARV